MPKQKIRAPEEIPLPEKKERKKRVVKDSTKKELTEVVGKMLAEATTPDTPVVSVIDDRFRSDDRQGSIPQPVEKKKRARSKAVAPKTKTMRGPNSWQIHLKDFRAKNPTITFKQAMADARATYVKV